MLLTLDASPNSWSLPFYVVKTWSSCNVPRDCRHNVITYQANRHFSVWYEIIIEHYISIDPSSGGQVAANQSHAFRQDSTSLKSLYPKRYWLYPRQPHIQLLAWNYEQSMTTMRRRNIIPRILFKSLYPSFFFEQPDSRRGSYGQ